MNGDFMKVTLALTALTGLGAAQDLVPAAAPQTKAILIQGATLHTVANGTLEDASILFEDGVITAVGPNSEVSASGAEVIDGAGKHVYPGFVAATTVLGLNEVSAVDMTRDNNEAGDVTPEVRGAIAINPDSWMLPVARRNGILTAGVMPQGGLISGRASVVRLDGWTNEDLEIVSDAGLIVNWPGVDWLTGAVAGSSDDEDAQDAAEALERLDELFDAAAAYGVARTNDPDVPVDLRFEAMQATIAGALPLFVRASSEAQITSAVSWAVGRNLKPIILGGRDAGLCVDMLVRHDVPVVIARTLRLPHRRDLSYATTFELPAQLEQAGVRWCLAGSTADSAGTRNLPYEAAACVAFGLDPEVALRSVTLAPAEVLGLGQRLGSLEVGKAATLFLADGDPFEFWTTIEAAWIDGRQVALTDKQTALDAKYREKYRQLGLLR